MSEYINRDLSWLEFNKRVLEEAEDKSNYLGERIKFLGITASNLDEFFMVRVASVGDQIMARVSTRASCGMTPEELLKALLSASKDFVKRQGDCYKDILESLSNLNISIVERDKYSENDIRYINSYFDKYVYPVLTPMAVDSGRPFPVILDRSLNIGVGIASEKVKFATVQIPKILDRLLRLPSRTGNAGEEIRFAMLEDVVLYNINKLFSGKEIEECFCYRITRNADLKYNEEGAEDLLHIIENSLKMRRWGRIVRLEISNSVSQSILSMLREEFEIEEDSVVLVDGIIDYTVMSKLYARQEISPLKEELMSGYEVDTGENIFEWIKRKDRILIHPYQSFDPVVKFIEQASKDPEVLAIKQTLYRVSGQSPIVKALGKAAENGKQVTVLLELKARFDEESNIAWAKTLERAGCHVIYGMEGLKVHSKIALVVRREDNRIARYLHLGTGNYNDVTARFYTDIGFFTCDHDFGVDGSNFFNVLSGFSLPRSWMVMDVAPYSLRDKFISLIEREIQNVKQGLKGKIIAKMNALLDETLINKLYKASKAGVEIELIVRGTCSLSLANGHSERVKVLSIVDTYLEHTRVYYFYNGGNDEVYLSSADMMQRNLDRRIELLFPIKDRDCKQEVLMYLEMVSKEEMKARYLDPKGQYLRKEGYYRSQREILKLYSGGV